MEHQVDKDSKNLTSLNNLPPSSLRLVGALQNPASQGNIFIGRERELATIEECFKDPGCRLLTLIGLGGIGKTRIAWEAGARITCHFEDSYFVSLAAISSPALIVHTLASSLGCLFQGTEPPVAQLIDFLRNRELLLVLDNFEHLLSGADLVAELLRAVPNLRLLITSRERLNLQQEWVLDIQGLDFPREVTGESVEHYSAMQFFFQCARRAKADFQFTEVNQPDVIRICRLVEGMPLGIELAASWVRVLSCRAIGDEIERSIDFLTTSLRDVPDKHRSMRAVFAHTYALLTAEQQQGFSKLSVFRGGFTREAAEQLAGASLHTVSALVDKSLLRVDETGRYDLHELLRQYAEEQLRTSSELEAARDAHSAYYAAFLQAKWYPLRTREQVETLGQIEVELENIRSAWHTMVNKCKTAELSMSLHSLWLFSDMRGHTYEALSMYEQAEYALRHAGTSDGDHVLGQILTCRGFFHMSMGKPYDARALIHEALAILERTGGIEDVITALSTLCLIDFFLNDIAALKQRAERTLQLAKLVPDRWFLTHPLIWLTLAEYHMLNYEAARAIGQQAFEIVEACGDINLRASVAQLFGDIAYRERHYSEARRWYARRLQFIEAIDQAVLVGEAHVALGHVAFCMKEYSDSVYHYQQSLRVLADLPGRTYVVMTALIGMAELWTTRHRYMAATELITLVIHHPTTLQPDREQALQQLYRLQVKLSPDTFAAAQGRGRELELSLVVSQLNGELSEDDQTPALLISPTVAVSLPIPLSARELDVLHLVAEGCSNRDIAARLFLSPGTVKWYLGEIYSKLGVHSRMQAVARVHDLNLLS